DSGRDGGGRLRRDVLPRGLVRHPGARPVGRRRADPRGQGHHRQRVRADGGTAPRVARRSRLAGPPAAAQPDRSLLPGLSVGAAMATYVLVHGAYQGGWIWKPVAERLRGAGHRVFAPTLDGCGERHDQVRPGITVATHGQEIAKLLFYEDLDRVMLVGTSSGGMVICKAAELARDRIGRLFFVDALALMSGERVGDIVKRAAPNDTSSI